MGEKVCGKCSKVRTEVQKRHNAQTTITTVNFIMGDLVLIRSTRGRGNKLSTILTRPMQIVEARSDLVIVVDTLRKDNQEVVGV